MSDLHPATGLPRAVFDNLLARLRRRRRLRGRPWATSLRRRLLLVCLALRTNLTMREIGALLGVSKSHVHRVIADLMPRLAQLFALSAGKCDRRTSWVVDGTLIPTRDHSAAAKSKNYRWSCNLQLLIRRCDLYVIDIAGGGPGNRNDPIHYRGSTVETTCREHGRVLADGGYRGVRSSSRRVSNGTGSFATGPGGVIVDDVLASSTPSQDSRTGARFATTAAELPLCSTRLVPSRFSTIPAWRHYGTTLSSRW